VDGNKSCNYQMSEMGSVMAQQVCVCHDIGG